MRTFKQVVLLVLDGWGYREDTQHNAVFEAETPNFDRLWNSYPHSLLHASGKHVGLPGEEMGNSEVGHMTIGAGKRIVPMLYESPQQLRTMKFGQIQHFNNFLVTSNSTIQFFTFKVCSVQEEFIAIRIIFLHS